MFYSVICVGSLILLCASNPCEILFISFTEWMFCECEAFYGIVLDFENVFWYMLRLLSCLNSVKVIIKQS